VMPLYAVLAREYFDQRIMGTVFGAATMLSSLGMALGPVVGGWIFDTYHDYRWLYLSSTAIAIAAAAVAVVFPPLSRIRIEADSSSGADPAAGLHGRGSLPARRLGEG
jgi:MFS family permease